MSLIRPVLRMCTVAALRGRTWAENRIFDSDNTPLIDALQAETKPYITIYTDDDSRTNVTGMDVYLTDRRVALVIEIGVASAVEVVAPDGVNKGSVLKIPQTDQAMEALIDFMESQVISALISDPYSEWGEVIRSIVNSISRMSSVRGGSGDRGTRWAARQISFICDTISDPAPGTILPSGHPIRSFIALAKDAGHIDADMVAAADLIETMINTTEAPDWRQAQAWLGLTKRTAAAIGLTPVEDTVSFSSERRVVEDQVLFDEEEGSINPTQEPF